jgi:hypothetical protein
MSDDYRHYIAHLIVMYMYLSVPPALMMIRAMWFGLLDSTVKNPSLKRLCLVGSDVIFVVCFQLFFVTR